MSYWILPVSGKPISTTNVQRMTDEEIIMDEYVVQMASYDSKIEQRLIIKDQEINLDEVLQWNRLSHDKADPLFKEEFSKIIKKDLIPEADQSQHHEDTPEIYAGYINMEIGLPHGIEGELLHARVKRRVINDNSQPVGVPHH